MRPGNGESTGSNMKTSFNEAWDFLMNHPLFKDEIGISHFDSVLCLCIEQEPPIELFKRGFVYFVRLYRYTNDLNKHRSSIIYDIRHESFQNAIIELAETVECLYGNTTELNKH
jgi:hypothetical protein